MRHARIVNVVKTDTTPSGYTLPLHLLHLHCTGISRVPSGPASMYDEKNPYNMHASCQLNPLLYYLNISQIATFEAGTASTLASGIYFVREWTCHRAQVSPLVALYISILIFLFVSNLLDTFRMTVPCFFVLLH